MSDFFELVAKRESCRAYLEKEVEKEKLIRCIEAARLSPSACNSQPWSFVVATGEKGKEVAKCTQKSGINKFTENCPAFIVITEEQARLSSRIASVLSSQHYAQIDIGLVTAHICYAATEQRLSTCILGWFDEKKLAEVVGIPNSKRIRLVISIGYAENDSLREKKRKPLEEILTFAE